MLDQLTERTIKRDEARRTFTEREMRASNNLHNISNAIPESAAKCRVAEKQK
jgi:hypothetical protein